MKDIEKLILDGEEVDLKEYVKQEDFEELKSLGVQQTPLFANNIDECTDTSKVYVLPDGYIYGYIDGADGSALYTNKIPLSVDDSGNIYNDVGYKKGVRYSTSSKAEKEYERSYITGWIHVYEGDIVRLKDLPISTSSDADAMMNSIYLANEPKEIQWTVYSSIIPGDLESLILDDASNVGQFTVPAGCNWVRFASTSINENSIVTVNEEIVSPTDKGWHNTGHAFVPANYEGRIVALENAMSGTVYGIVGEDNTILLAGGLVSGTYKLKYRNEDGTTSEIGNITVK